MSDPSPKKPPKGLRPEEIATLLAESSESLIGARVEKVYDAPPHGFLFRFRAPAGRRNVFFTTRPGTSRFHFVDDVGETPKAPTDAASELRTLVGGMRVAAIDQPGGDRVARIRFIRGRDESPSATLDLVFEFFGRAGRLLIVDPESKLIRFVHGRGGVKTRERYRFPEPPPRPDGETWTMPFEPRAHVPPDLLDHDAPFHRFLELRMRDEELRLDRYDRIRSVLTRLRRERKRRKQLIEKLDRDRTEAMQYEKWQRWGDLLKGSQGEMHRGQTEIEVTDWFAPDTPRVTIPLEPASNPAENVQRCFRRARKGKRSLAPLDERLGRLTEELTSLEGHLHTLRDFTPADLGEDSTPLESAEAWLTDKERSRPPQRGGAGSARAVRREKGKPEPGRRFRRYRTREGLDVLAGKSARENDELSIRVARGNDLFFHRSGRPGPHVILRVPRGVNASPESIDDAAYIAAYLAGWRGPGDERVMWTEAKNVRKPKGLPPGQVLTHRTREHRVRYQVDRMAGLSTAGESP